MSLREPKTLSFLSLSLSLSLFSLREATSNRTPDTFSFYLDLRELLFALGKNVAARTMQPDTEYYFSYIIACNAMNALSKVLGRDLLNFLTKFNNFL